MTYVFLTASSTTPRLRTQLLLGVVLAALLAAILTPAVAGPRGPAGAAAGTARPATAPLRVALVGDSMTQGQSGSATYRYWLWRAFGAQGVPVTFVGPYTRLARGGGASVYSRLDRGFETRHGAVAGTGFALHLRRVRDLVREHRPQVVVLQLGFNDAGHHTAEQIAADTTRYLDRAWEENPNLRFVVAEIPPRGAGESRKNERTAAANDLVAAAYESEERVTISRLRTHPTRPWDTTLHTYDGVHPNAVGETLMAQRHAEALAALDVLPRAGWVYRARAAWRPAVRPALPRGTDQARVVVRDRRIVVNVRDTLRRAHAHRAQVQVTVRGRTVRRTRWTAVPRVAVRLRPGRYRVRLGVQRGTMRGLTRPAVVRVR